MTNWISKFDPSKKLSDKKALELIGHIVNYGTIISSSHAEGRSGDRNFTDQDVIHILENGSVLSKKYNKKFQQWKYKIEGHDLDGEDGVVVTAIIDSASIVIISVM